MAKKNPDEEELWLEFAHAALDRLAPLEITSDIDSAVDDVIGFATKYADSMLDELDRRYGEENKRGARRKRKSRAVDDDDDEDDDDDDERD